MNLLNELKRRNVYRAAIAYLIVAWLLLQVADVVFGIIGTPTWVQQSVLAVLALGFPVAMLLAWVFELTPEGLKREDVAPGLRQTRRRGISDRVLIVLLVLAVGVLLVDEFWFDRPETSSSAATATVAVLPFANLSPDVENDYLADGLAAELLNLLTTIPNLKVAAPTSSFAFRGRNVDVTEIARQLRVSYVLSGSVRQSGDALRITAQLSDAQDGFHIWSNSWESEFKDIFDIQDEIAASVANSMRVEILGAAPTRKRTHPEAYALYIESGEVLREKLEPVVGEDAPARLERAYSLINRSIALDPEFAPAWGRLAEIQYQRAQWMTADPSEPFELAVAAAERALSLDQAEISALLVLGHVDRLWNWDVKSAAQWYERAFRMNSEDVRVLRAISVLLSNLGMPAVALTRRAVELDPLNSGVMINLAIQYFHAGQRDLARAKLDDARKLSPDAIRIRAVTDTFNYLEGHYEKVVQKDGSAVPQIRICALHALHREEEAQVQLDEMVAGGEDLYAIATAHACSGDTESAFAALYRAYAMRSQRLTTIRGDLVLQQLHGDPKWNELLHRIGVSDADAEDVRTVFSDMDL